MCDTFVALNDATQDGNIIFGKNSDRPNGEVQDVITLPAQTYADATSLRCSYIDIPQVTHTHAVILSKPSWMWGAEMGANEHGVVIGNEAVWTNQPYREIGLLGMDLLRLGLERSTSAEAALHTIIELLHQHGQGGNCAEHFAMSYHNSFLIADSHEAWVLETAGKYWVAEYISNGTRSISNNLSIYHAGDLRHPDIIADMQAADKLKPNEPFNFAKVFSSDHYQKQLSPYSREGRVRELCQTHAGQFTAETAQSILRQHDAGICAHGEFETRGSQVSVLSHQNCQHYFIHAPFPCQQDYQRTDFASSC